MLEKGGPEPFSMPFTSRSIVSIGVSICAATSLALTLAAQEKPKKNLTARELFYAAVQSSPPVPKADTPKAPPKAAPRPPRSTPKPTDVARANDKQSSTPSDYHPAAPDTSQASRPTPEAPKADATGPALGLRYTILKVAGSGTVEVAPDTVFHAGDRIQLKVEANNPGYLYIVNQGSSGTWKPIFPSPEVEGGNNRVESLHAYTLPSEEHRMVFDETAGSEKLFVILSRQPEPDLEKMIYSLQSKSADKPDDSLKSSREMIMAVNIDNDTVGRMRQVYARDLVIEKVTPATPGEKKETAVYVVNPTGSSSARVVADLNLVHQ